MVKEVIEEEIDDNIVTALMRNYRNAPEAIFEIIDNAVDDRIEGQTTKIEILLRGKKSLKITNHGGMGMGFGELKDFFRWGRSKKREKLGRYGQGGKAAMGYLGKSWTIRCSKRKENVTYEITEPDWRTREKGKKRYIPQRYSFVPQDMGFVEIEIRWLTRPINRKKLIEKLKDTYNLLISKNKISIEVDGEKIKPIVFPLTKEIGLNERLGDGRKITGWIGVLEKEKESGLGGGVRCCVYERKITEGEYFGHPDYYSKASMHRLIGETNADHLPLNLNKTDFDRDDYRWQQFEQKMKELLLPLVRNLLEEPDELATALDRERVKKAGKIWNQFLKYLAQERTLVGRIGSGIGEDFGQKPPEPKGGVIYGSIGKVRGKYTPQTPPPLGAIGKRRRTKGFSDFDAKPLPDTEIRSKVIQENDADLLVINTNFPAYRKRREKTERYLYIWETIILENSRPEKGEEISHDEFIDEMNRLTAKFYNWLDKEKIKV